jgi:hypothetical protein
MTDAERRERARLRSERWRRAHGIMPRKPASKPWLAMNISRSTYYRRRAKARQLATQQAVFARAQGFVAQLSRDLARCAALERECMAIVTELAEASGGTRLAAGG